MEIRNEKIGFSFDLPERLNVRQQLKIMSATRLGDPDYFGIVQAAWPFMENWQCDLVPDLKSLNIDTETNPKITALVYSVAIAIFLHAQRHEEADPN